MDPATVARLKAMRAAKITAAKLGGDVHNSNDSLASHEAPEAATRISPSGPVQVGITDGMVGLSSGPAATGAQIQCATLSATADESPLAALGPAGEFRAQFGVGEPPRRAFGNYDRRANAGHADDAYLEFEAFNPEANKEKPLDETNRGCVCALRGAVSFKFQDLE